jgi:hypothetical protein
VMIVCSGRLDRPGLANLCGPSINSADLISTSVVRVQPSGSVRLTIQGPTGPREGSDAADLEDRLPTGSRWSGAR